MRKMAEHDVYHRHARDCIALASKSNDEMQRAQLFAMAEAWTKLGQRAKQREAPPAIFDG
jgi:hypothetical protein